MKQARVIQSKEVDFDFQMSDLLEHKDCLFFDTELQGLYKASKTLYDIMKVVHTRFVQRRTLSLSPSVAQYLELHYDSEHFPETVFDFRFKLTRICIYKYKNLYCVYSSYDEHSDTVAVYRQKNNDRLYGSFEKLEDSFDLFGTVVDDFLYKVVKNELF